MAWAAPATIEDAERRYTAAADVVARIQAELSDKNRRDPATGARLTRQQYAEWKRAAVVELHDQQGECRRLKAWIRAAYRASTDESRTWRRLLERVARWARR